MASTATSPARATPCTREHADHRGQLAAPQHQHGGEQQRRGGRRCRSQQLARTVGSTGADIADPACSCAGRTRRRRRAAPGRRNRPAARVPGTAAAWPGTPRPPPAPRAEQRRPWRRTRRPRRAASAADARSVAMPHGANRSASSPRNTVSRIDEASSTRARSGPGVLQHHRLVHHRQLQVGGRVVDRQPPGLGDDHHDQRDRRRAGWPGRAPGAGRAGGGDDAARFVDPTGTDSAKIATSRVGSTRARMVTSRLAPIPPNAVPVSMPGQRQRDRAQRQQRHHREQIGCRVQHRCGGHERGDRGHHRDGGDQHSSGAVRNTSLVPCGVMGCLRSQLAQVPPRLQHARRRRGPPSGPGSAASPRPAAATAPPRSQDAARRRSHSRCQLADSARVVTGSPPAGSASPHNCEAVAEVAVHAAVGQPRPGPAPGRAPRRGPGRRGGARSGRVPAAGTRPRATR